MIFDDKRNRDLANCALVCIAWVPRAQMHLFTCILPIEFDDRLFASFWQAVKQKPFLLNYTNRISIVGSKGICVYKGTTEAETTGFLATCRMPNLIHLTIQFLDLSSSHPLRSRFPILSKTLKALTVIECLTDNVNQLCRFITSFQSLTTLCLGWHVECLVGDLMQHMHVNRSRCNSSIENLAVKLVPRFHALFDALSRTGPFISNLKRLIIAYDYGTLRESSLFAELREVLLHCSRSLEKVTFVTGELVEVISDPSRGMYVELIFEEYKLIIHT